MKNNKAFENIKNPNIILPYLPNTAGTGDFSQLKNYMATSTATGRKIEQWNL